MMTAEILAREGVLLALLMALGLGPVAYLPRSWGHAARLAFAPAFGLAIGAAALTTVSFMVPLRHSLWFAVLPMCALSSGLAVRRWRPQAVERRELGALALLVFWGIGVFSLPLLVRQSYGPMGYGVFDAPGYSSYIFGFVRNTTDDPIGTSPDDWEDPKYDRAAWGEAWDLTSRYAWGWIFQHTGSTTIPAAVSRPFDWPAWTLVNPFMVALATTAVVGVFGLALLLLERRVVAAAGAALLTGGPTLLQIHVDGSAGLLAGLALLPAILAMLWWALDETGGLRSVPLGLLLAGLQAVYPELLPVVGVTCAIAWAALRIPIRHLVAAAGLGAVLSPRTLPWTLDYLIGVATGELDYLDRLIDYDMGLRSLLGWLVQTRPFYSFAFGPPREAGQLLWGVVLPLLLLGPVCWGLVRTRALRIVAAVVAAAVLQAIAVANAGCSYCVQRSLLVLAPTLPILLFSGILGFWRHVRWRPLVGGVTALLLIGVATVLARSERMAIDGAYFPSSRLTRVAAAVEQLPKDGAALHLEGFDTMPHWSWPEVPTTYAAMRETNRRLSIVASYNEYGAFSYLRTRSVGHPSFSPAYGWVLTRFAALDTGRETIKRFGPLALQRRAQPFDASLVRGAGVDFDDQKGVPWVVPAGERFDFEQGPLTAWVTGPADVAASLEVRLQAPPGTSISGPPGTRATANDDGVVVGCLPAPEGSALRVVTFSVIPPPPDLEPRAKPIPPFFRPAHAVRLLTLRPHANACAP